MGSWKKYYFYYLSGARHDRKRWMMICFHIDWAIKQQKATRPGNQKSLLWLNTLHEQGESLGVMSTSVHRSSSNKKGTLMTRIASCTELMTLSCGSYSVCFWNSFHNVTSSCVTKRRWKLYPVIFPEDRVCHAKYLMINAKVDHFKKHREIEVIRRVYPGRMRKETSERQN